MLTGKLPFTGQTTGEALIKRLTDPPLTLAAARPDLAWPAALQQVLDKALARPVADRYQHASEFGAALVASVAGMPAEAPPAPPAAPTTQIAAPTAASATAAPRATAPASGGSRLVAPAMIAAGLLIVAAGAWYLRTHNARGASRPSTVASSAATDTAHAAPPPPAVTTAPPAIATSDSVAPATDSASASAPAPTPPPVPPPAPAPAQAAPVTHKKSATAPATHGASERAAGTTTTTTIPPAVTAPAPAPPPPPAADIATSTEPAAPSTVDEARAQVDAAGRMVAEGKPGEAILLARGAMPRLTTRDDSVTALYYLAQGMVMRSAKTGEQESRKRACSILSLIGKATSHPKAAEIRSFSLQECK